MTNNTTAQLNVVVWSTLFQRPVPAVGVLTNLGNGEILAIDTSSTPTEGQIIPNLSPGLYRLEILHRVKSDGTKQRVRGSEEIYLEPGRRSEVTVATEDRGDDVGALRQRQHTLPAISSPSLPLVAERWSGNS